MKIRRLIESETPIKIIAKKLTKGEDTNEGGPGSGRRPGGGHTPDADDNEDHPDWHIRTKALAAFGHSNPRSDKAHQSVKHTVIDHGDGTETHHIVNHGTGDAIKVKVDNNKPDPSSSSHGKVTHVSVNHGNNHEDAGDIFHSNSSNMSSEEHHKMMHED